MIGLFSQIEINFILFLQSLGHWLMPVMQFFTFLGSEYTYMFILPLIYWCIDATIGVRTGVMLVMSNTTNGLIKLAFHSPRPYWVDARVQAFSAETSFGFPSGHSFNAAAIWGVVIKSFKKPWLTMVGLLTIFMIGLSRLYLGVHFVSDVLGGWLLGGLFLLLVSYLEKPVVRWIKARSFSFQIFFFFAVSLVLILLGFLFTKVSPSFVVPQSWINQALASSNEAPDPYSLEGFYTVAGVFFGFTSGYAWLCKKFGLVVVKGTFGKRAIRLLLGLVGVGLIYFGLKLILPVDPPWLGVILRYIRYALVGWWVAAGAPIVFKLLHLDE